MTIYGVNPPGFGVEPETRDGVFIVRGGNVSAGRCYPMCLVQSTQITSDSVTISTTPGDPGFPYACISAGGTASGDRLFSRSVVALEDGLDLQPVRCRIKGLVRARVRNSGNQNITIGQVLTLSTNGTSDMDGNSNNWSGGSTQRRAVGVAMEAYSSTPSDGTTMLVDFNGWDPWFGNST